MGIRRLIWLSVVAASMVIVGFALGSVLAQAQQPPQPYPSYPPYPPPNAYPRPAPAPLPFPFPIPFPDPAARDLLLDGADKLIRALELMILTIPTYDAPVVTPDGDVLIKRRRGAPMSPPLPPKRLPEPIPDRTTL